MEDALKNLQNKYDALLKENNKNMDKISALQKKVKSLRTNSPYLKCEECEYPAEDLCDLGSTCIQPTNLKLVMRIVTVTIVVRNVKQKTV